MRYLFQLLAACLLPVSGIAQMAAALSDTLADRFTELYSQQNPKSISAAVFFPDSSVWESAKGNLGSTGPLTTDHLMEMGSNTKTMVSAIILQMQEEGLLNIDDTIYHHINKLPEVPPRVTIKQLLNHTSGIYDYTTSSELFNKVNADPSKFWPVDSIFNYMQAPNFSAGTDYEYCNTGYIILGLIIEAVDGKPFHQSLRDRLLSPLNLDETYLAVYENYTSPKAGSWLSNGSYFDMPFDALLSLAWSAGAILATPGDLAEWAYLLYNGGVLSQASLNEMMTTVVINGNDKHYGLGYGEKTYKGNTYHGHGGTTLQNSTMNYSANSRFSIVININEQNTSGTATVIENGLIDVLETQIPLIEQTDTTDTTTAIASKGSIFKGISIYPNPAGEEAVISYPGQVKMNVYSYNGQLVFTEQFQNKTTVERAEVGQGIFLVTLRNAHGERISGKLMFR